MRRFMAVYGFGLVAMLLASPARASWPVQGLLIDGAPRTQFNPIPMADGAGGTYICWCSMVDDTSGDLRLVRITGDGQVALGWPARGVTLLHVLMRADDPLYSYAPISLARDGSGGVYACIQGTIWHVNGLAGFADGWPAAGRSLIPPGVLIASGSQIAADDAGGIFACWADMQDGDMHVRAQHLSASGDPCPGWLANGVRLSNPYWSQEAPTVVPDGVGGAWLGWIEDGWLP